jgi:hypothetical protein
MGIEPDDRFEQQAKRDAEAKGWEFHKVRGDIGLITRLVDGAWDEDTFLVIPPGRRLEATYDDQIIAVCPGQAG